MANLTRRQFFRLSGVALFAATVMPTALLGATPANDVMTLAHVEKAINVAKTNSWDFHTGNEVIAKAWAKHFWLKAHEDSFFYKNKDILYGSITVIT